MVKELTSSKSRPSMLVLGAATHTIRDANNSAEVLDQYKDNITKMRPV